MNLALGYVSNILWHKTMLLPVRVVRGLRHTFHGWLISGLVCVATLSTQQPFQGDFVPAFAGTNPHNHTIMNTYAGYVRIVVEHNAVDDGLIVKRFEQALN